MLRYTSNRLRDIVILCLVFLRDKDYYKFNLNSSWSGVQSVCFSDNVFVLFLLRWNSIQSKNVNVSVNFASIYNMWKTFTWFSIESSYISKRYLVSELKMCVTQLQDPSPRLSRTRCSNPRSVWSAVYLQIWIYVCFFF